ncbi:MAG: hypothetical protein Pg6A_02780 [Termitinemataceae bacterium]|nr:MAG: hypothetical protein Pg6A_02780 [Termitinemataceae bacterium]
MKIKLALLPLFLVLIHTGAQSAFPANVEKIPLLISDHHAEHAPFILRYTGTEPDNRVCMIVIDAHTDTIRNIFPPAGNHDWISTLYPFPLETLIWIYSTAGFTTSNSSKARSFYSSIYTWDAGGSLINARAISLDNLSNIDFSATTGQTLFISIDLDFFCMGNSTPADIPFVFDVLFDFTSRRQGKAVWALALSRAWLPDDKYAWELLRQSLRWFCGKTSFTPPELHLFTTQFEDTSRLARALRAKKLPMPSFYGKENKMPNDIRKMLKKLNQSHAEQIDSKTVSNS